MATTPAPASTRIERARTSRNLTQEELAAYAHLTLDRIRALEAGVTPRIGELMEIASVTGTSLQALTGSDFAQRLETGPHPNPAVAAGIAERLRHFLEVDAQLHDQATPDHNDWLRSRVNMSLAIGDLAASPLPVHDTDGRTPIVIASSAEPVGALLTRIRQVGGAANVVIDEGGVLRLFAVIGLGEDQSS